MRFHVNRSALTVFAPNTIVSPSAVDWARALLLAPNSRLTVRNTGGKAFKSVAWAHVFYDAATGKELKRYRLQHKQRVAAGETATLGRPVYIKPDESTRHLTAGRQRVQITRVEFEGGGDWKADAGDVRKP